MTPKKSSIRADTFRALGKTLAYYQCGKHSDAKHWAERLVAILAGIDVLPPLGRRNSRHNMSGVSVPDKGGVRE